MSDDDDDEIIIRHVAEFNHGSQPPYTVGTAKVVETALEDAAVLLQEVYDAITDTTLRAKLQQAKAKGNDARQWIHGVRTYTP